MRSLWTIWMRALNFWDYFSYLLFQSGGFKEMWSQPSFLISSTSGGWWRHTVVDGGCDVVVEARSSAAVAGRRRAVVRVHFTAARPTLLLLLLLTRSARHPTDLQVQNHHRMLRHSTTVSALGLRTERTKRTLVAFRPTNVAKLLHSAWNGTDKQTDTRPMFYAFRRERPLSLLTTIECIMYFRS